jgi:16S rRNA (guanine966-N2)-methyltransferase
MRIDAGSHRGLKLAVPEGETRPTADRARQAVFNILVHTYDAIRDAKVLDVFAGSGALGLECLSRGAARASFIESDRAAAEVIKRNVAACKEQARSQLFVADATRPPRAVGETWAPCSLVFLDPPYGKDLLAPTLRALRDAGWIAADGLVVAEMHRKDALDLDGFETLDDRTYGKARFMFLRANA